MSVFSSVTRTKLHVPDKRKMLLFSQQMQFIGCQQGFKHISLYLRSPEELMVTVANNNTNAKDIADDKLDQVNFDAGLADSNHPPSSPCVHAQSYEDEEYTVYLIGCYEKYLRPFVWLRTGHGRLIERLEIVGPVDRDSPLDLYSVTDYMSEEVSVWDMIAEVVLLTTEPPPANPFEIDHAALDLLPHTQQALLTGSLLHVLSSLLGKVSKWATEAVLKDIKHLSTRHVHHLSSLAE